MTRRHRQCELTRQVPRRRCRSPGCGLLRYQLFALPPTAAGRGGSDHREGGEEEKEFFNHRPTYSRRSNQALSQLGLIPSIMVTSYHICRTCASASGARLEHGERDRVEGARGVLRACSMLRVRGVSSKPLSHEMVGDACKEQAGSRISQKKNGHNLWGFLQPSKQV